MMYTEAKPLPGSSKNPFRPLSNCKNQPDNAGLRRNSYSKDAPHSSVECKKDEEGFKVPKSFKCSVTVKDIKPPFVIKGEPVSEQDALVNMEDIQLDDFLSFSQAVDDMDDELDDSDRHYLLHNKSKHHSSWNQFCKNTQGVQFAPLVKSNGRMKAAHKSDIGKKGIHNLLKKKVK